MVKAILAGTKTQTRRVLQPQPHDLPAGDVYCDPYNHNYEHFTFWTRPDNLMCLGVGGNIKDTCHWRCPYGVPGDRLYVKEAWNGTQGEGVTYKATDWDIDAGPWRSGRFMPRWAARLFLEVTDVRVERVTAISAEDALAEGTQGQHSFAVLWDRLQAKRGYPFASGCWVWAIAFRRVEGA
jgi:hypothetical protein